MSSNESVEDSAGLQRMRQRVALFDAEMYKIGPRGINFKPRGDDVMVVTPGKCGTTWMQQVVHQLRSGGDMSYRNIGDVVHSSKWSMK